MHLCNELVLNAIFTGMNWDTCEHAFSISFPDCKEGYKSAIKNRVPPIIRPVSHVSQLKPKVSITLLLSEIWAVPLLVLEINIEEYFMQNTKIKFLEQI